MPRSASQLAAFQRKRKRPVLTALDRVFWVTLRRWWSGWRGPLFSVQADTVTHWQRERFRRFWAPMVPPAWPTTRPTSYGLADSPIDPTHAGRQSVVACAAPPRQAENAGSEIPERTGSRILRRLPRPPSQTALPHSDMAAGAFWANDSTADRLRLAAAWHKQAPIQDPFTSASTSTLQRSIAGWRKPAGCWRVCLMSSGADERIC